jgi:NADH-quinone oxidoreductase subunit A
MGNQYGYVAVFAAVGVAFVIITLIAAWVLRPHRPSRGKTTSYECGILPVGDAWGQFNIRFYVIALLFVLFEVEAAYLYPWAVRVGKLGTFALVEMLIFLGILGFGLAYAWRKGGLTWE